MPEIQTNAERTFYDKIGLILSSEMKDMGNGVDSELLKIAPNLRKEYLPAYDLNRDARLYNLFNDFKIEIEKNIIILTSPYQKKDLLENYLERAIEHKNQLMLDYDKYLQTPHVKYFLVSTTHNQLYYIYKLINAIKRYKDGVDKKIATQQVPLFTGNEKPVIINGDILLAEGFIDPLLIGRFRSIESKATNNLNNFDSAIRCAAFCEMLYKLGILINTKTNIKTMVSFAKLRYGKVIAVQLTGSKKVAREQNKFKTVNKLSPLNNAFK